MTTLKTFSRVKKCRRRIESTDELVYLNLATGSREIEGIDIHNIQDYNFTAFSQDNARSPSSFEWFRLAKNIRIFPDLTYEVAVETVNRKVKRLFLALCRKTLHFANSFCGKLKKTLPVLQLS
jgi:uncharacterized circularly permuted ATP-grasp superfamily protein